MRALFVGGMVDNSELDLDGAAPPAHYPENGGSGVSRYRLSRIGRTHDDAVAYAVYAAPELAEDAIQQVCEDRGYARRFEATETIAA